MNDTSVELAQTLAARFVSTSGALTASAYCWMRRLISARGASVSAFGAQPDNARQSAIQAGINPRMRDLPISEKSRLYGKGVGTIESGYGRFVPNAPG